MKNNTVKILDVNITNVDKAWFLLQNEQNENRWKSEKT